MSKSFYKFPNVFPQSLLKGVNFLQENDNFFQEDPLNECRKQFFKSGKTLYDRRPHSFSSKLEKFVKVNFFFRKRTFLEKFCCSSKMHFGQLLLNFCANVADFSADSQKTVTKLKKVIEKTVQSKISFGQIKCSFNEPAESSYRTPKTFSLKFRRKTWNFSHESAQIFWSVLEKNVKIFSKIKFFTEIFCTHKVQFWQTFWSFCAKMPECFPQSPKTVKLLIYFCRKTDQSKISTGHIECSFHKPIAKFSPKVQKICARRPKIKKHFKEFVFKNKLFRKNPLDTWKQFWPPKKFFFAKNPKCFPQSLKTTENFEEFVKQKIISSQMSSGHKKNSFDHHVKKIYKISNIFPQSPLVGVSFLEENDNVTQKIPLNECRKQFFKTDGRLSGRSLQSFSSKLEKIVKVIIFFRKQTFLEKFCCSSRMHFWQLLWNFCFNVAEISAHSRKTV